MTVTNDVGRLVGSLTGIAALLLGGVAGLAACTGAKPKLHSPGGFGALPAAASSPISGGTVSFGMLPGQTPNYIFPVTPAAKSSAFTIRDFQYLMWRPLYWPTVGTKPAINYGFSLAGAPLFSDGNKTVTIRLDDYRWSDGQPVSAKDVIFSIDLVKAAVKESAANWGNYTPGFFPDNVVSATAQGPRTVVLRLDRAYNPGWFQLDELSLVVPLPAAAWSRTSANGPIVDFTAPAVAKRVYDFLAAQSGELASYATNPLWQTVDGPFKIVSFSASTGANSLVPNPSYAGPSKPRIARINEVAYTSNLAELDALLAHQLTVGTIPGQDVPQVHALSKAGYNFYGYPNFGWSYLPFNFKDTTGHWNSMVAQLYLRQALAHLIDQPAYIKGVYLGAAEPAYGPVPTLPESQYTPSDARTDPYPYGISAAKSLLTAHGWKADPAGADTCVRPGTGAGRCGAGIPGGTKLSFNLIYDNQDSSISAQVTAFVSAARRAGVRISLSGKSFDTIITTYNNPSAPASVNSWAMEDFGGFGDLLYPTTNGIFSSTGSFNFGSYSSAKADALIKASVYGTNPSAVRAEAAYLTRDLPALFLPNSDVIIAWSKALSGPPSSFASLTQASFTPEAWYFTK